MDLNQSTFEALRAKQAELGALADQEAERAKQLAEAQAKVERLSNTIATALADPRSTWTSIEGMNRDRTLAELDVVSLTAQHDPVRSVKAEVLLREVTSEVAVLSGKPDPFEPELNADQANAKETQEMTA